VLGQRLDSMILEVSSNLGDSVPSPRCQALFFDKCFSFGFAYTAVPDGGLDKMNRHTVMLFPTADSRCPAVGNGPSLKSGLGPRF